MVSRRSLFTIVPAIAFGSLVSCSADNYVSFEQAIVDLKGIATAINVDMPLIVTLFPKAFVTTSEAVVAQWLNMSINALNGLTGTSLVAITNLATAEQDLNLVLNVLEPVVAAVGAASPEMAAIAATIQAAISLAPSIELLLQQLQVPVVVKPSARLFEPVTMAELSSHIHTIPVAKAREVLKIKKLAYN